MPCIRDLSLLTKAIPSPQVLASYSYLPRRYSCDRTDRRAESVFEKAKFKRVLVARAGWHVGTRCEPICPHIGIDDLEHDHIPHFHCVGSAIVQLRLEKSKYHFLRQVTITRRLAPVIVAIQSPSVIGRTVYICIRMSFKSDYCCIFGRKRQGEKGDSWSIFLFRSPTSSGGRALDTECKDPKISVY